MDIAVGFYFRKLPTRNFHLLHKICRTLYELECNRVGSHRDVAAASVGCQKDRYRGLAVLVRSYRFMFVQSHLGRQELTEVTRPAMAGYLTHHQ